ncbi:monoheme cytochrome C [bacterium SCSIO 12741]|nr:monoheme cytochrome C [bacterium SCSIO 12741]
MKQPLDENQVEGLRKLTRNLRRFISIAALVLGFLFYAAIFDPSLGKLNRWIAEIGQTTDPSPQQVTESEPEVKEGIHLPTGLVAEGDYLLVAQHCTPCHSAKLVTQNRMTAEAWTSTIHWMQETQNLWDLGENEALIVAYLSTYYAPEETGRRKPLKVEEWYTLD